MRGKGRLKESKAQKGKKKEDCCLWLLAVREGYGLKITGDRDGRRCQETIEVYEDLEHFFQSLPSLQYTVELSYLSEQ